METQVENTGESYAVAAEPVAVGHEQSQAEYVPEMVPVTALQAERRERQQLQEQNKLLQDHMTLMQSNQQRAPQPDQYAGMSDDDVLTVGEAKKFLGNIQKNYQTSVDELRVQQKYSDYDKVVKTYLPDVLKKNPSLKSTLQNDANKYELAYFLAKNSDDYRETTKQAKKSPEAQRIVENGHRAGSLSAVGSTTSQSQSGNIRNMTDADFMKMANRNLGRF